MMVVLVYLEILENPVVLEAKVFPESRMDIQEAPEPRVNLETQDSLAAVVWTALEETMVSQEVQDTV